MEITRKAKNNLKIFSGYDALWRFMTLYEFFFWRFVTFHVMWRKRRKLSDLFRADFGKESPSQTLWRGPSWNCSSASCVLCPSLCRTEHFSRERKGRRRCQQKGRKRGGQQRGRKEKRTRENRSAVGFKIPWHFLSWRPPAFRSINRRKSATNPELASINVCWRQTFCNFPTLSVEILTAPPLQPWAPETH